MKLLGLIGMFISGLLVACSSTETPTLEGVQVKVTNTIQAGFTDNAEVPFGQDIGFKEVGTGLEFNDVDTKFVYDIDVSDNKITLSWVSNETNDKLARVIEEGTFDRYYFTFDKTVIAAATATSSAALVPDITKVTGTEIVVQVGPGMKVGPGQDIQIDLTLK